jgi:hypothetical protein
MTNRKSFRRSLIAPCVLICLATAFATQSGAAQDSATTERPNFTGTWRLNRELSDKPQEKVKEAVGKRGALGRMIGGRGAQGKIQDRMKNMEGFGEVLKITHNDPEFQVSGNSDVSRQIFTDGRKVSATTPKGESFETTAHWQGSQLVVVTQRANGGKLTQTYSLAEGDEQMIVLIQIAAQRLDRPIEMRFVYDAEAGR